MMMMNSHPSFDEALGHKPTVAQRESRIGSIYEKYLYDPKDLKSSDPVIRALARKASQDSDKSHEPRATTPSGRIWKSSPSGLQQKEGDAARSTATASTDCAWDGFSALVEESSDFDDASDDEEAVSGRTLAAAATTTTTTAATRATTTTPKFIDDSQSESSSFPASDSWGTRVALAVGQRPPDGASQNPPSLKLLGLGGQRTGGGPPSYSSKRQQPGLRIVSRDISRGEKGDTDFHADSTIDFGKQRPEQTASEMSVLRDASQRSRSRQALTAQLGLDTPLLPPKDGEREDYFASRASRTSSSKYSHPQQPPNAVVRSPATSGASSTTSSPHTPSWSSSPHSHIRSLISPPLSPCGSGRLSSPHSPRPLLLCQGLDSGSPLKLKSLPPVLGFSEASHTRKQSLLRRSVAFVTGVNADSQREADHDSAMQPETPVKKGRASFRKSMNLLVGKSTISRPAGEKLEDQDQHLAPPRVRWFAEEEVPGTPTERKFQGPRDGCEEWDADGAAAEFWRRFEIAQKKAGSEAQASVNLRRKLESRRKAHICSVAAAGALILALVIAIIVWRTNTSSGTDRPAAVEEGEYSGVTRARRALIPTATRMARRNNIEPRNAIERRLWMNAQVQQAAATPMAVVEPARREAATFEVKREALRQSVKRHSQIRRRLHQ